MSSSVSVLLGKGDGTFRPQKTYPAGIPFSVAYSVAVGDLNDDGKVDLVVVNQDTDTWSDNVSVFLGNGDGTFRSQTIYLAGYLPTSVAIGDLNGDGKADLAVASWSYGLSVLLGNGDGSFQLQSPHYIWADPAAVAMGDFTGDGKADLVAAGSTVMVFSGKGDGTFVQGSNLYSAGPVTSFAVGDFNGDGRADLALTDYLDDLVLILLNTTRSLPAALPAGARSDSD